MEKAIRILSFQNAQNFGAVLQAYGLQKTLNRLGFEDVEFINYNPGYLSKRYMLFKPKWYIPSKGGLHYIASYYWNLPFDIINRWRRNRKFNGSRKHLLIQTEKKYSCLEEIKDIRCEYLICGSDQIWSTWITGTPDPVYYGIGDYVGLKKIVTYAPSTELSTFENPEYTNIIKEYLKGIDCISVREKSVSDILYNNYGITAKVCVDPTLLCGVDAFNTISGKRLIKKNYILVYTYKNRAKLIQDLIKTIPDYEAYEVHYVSFGSSGARDALSRFSHNEITVENFVSLFRYASYIVTNSFHGLAFSLLYQCPFAVAYEEGKSERCKSLLTQLNSLDKLVYKPETMNWHNYDFKAIEANLKKIREESEVFLLDSLKD